MPENEEATKQINVTLKVVSLNVRESMTDDEISAMLDRMYGKPDVQWNSWSYEEDWRN